MSNELEQRQAKYDYVVKLLMQGDLAIRQIAAIAGKSPKSVRKIYYGENPRPSRVKGLIPKHRCPQCGAMIATKYCIACDLRFDLANR